MTHAKMVREVAKRGVDGAAELCHGMNAETLKATLKWYDGKGDQTPNLLAWKLKEGGIYVPDDETPAPGTIWKQEDRVAWIEKFMPEEMEKDAGFRAEVAIIGVVRQGQQPSPLSVRRFMAEVEPSKPRSIQPIEPQRGFTRVGDAVKDVAA